MATGIITEIERYAVHDGPGIRTIVFLKGCPLSCQWCANPETQNHEPELYYNSKKCRLCLKCKNVCPRDAITLNKEKNAIRIDRNKCTVCVKCSEACPENALQIVGKKINTEEVFQEIKKDISFYRESGGGVTLSGGEVLQQTEFAASILKKCKKEYINTAIETTGYSSFDNLNSIMKYTDLVLFDIKHMDSDRHKELTGVNNKLILDNLRKIRNKLDKEVVIRIPLISGINDDKKNILAVKKLALKLDIKNIHFLPYHSLGVEKYRKLDRKYPGKDFLKPEEDKIKAIIKNLENNKIKVNIGGG